MGDLQKFGFTPEAEKVAAEFYTYALEVTATSQERNAAFTVARASVGSRLDPMYWVVAELALRRIVGNR
jgi:hypothetical protein